MFVLKKRNKPNRIKSIGNDQRDLTDVRCSKAITPYLTSTAHQFLILFTNALCPFVFPLIFNYVLIIQLDLSRNLEPTDYEAVNIHIHIDLWFKYDQPKTVKRVCILHDFFLLLIRMKVGLKFVWDKKLEANCNVR